MKSKMAQFWNLLERSIILQSIITTSFVLGALYLWLTRQTVPNELLQGLWIVLGYWFGTKAQHSIDAAVSKKGS